MRAISDISTIEINGVIHYLPKTETDVKILIKDAIATQKTLFVRGSGHSFPLNHEQKKKHKFTYILMSYFNRVNINMKEMRVTVGGGCHLGYDPFDPVTDPSCRSTLKNSLFYKLFRKGLAIPEMGGITHQTVAGFLSTGSAGGSLKYSFGGMLESITIITAENSPRRITFPDDTTIDEFNAAAVAMGLFGIIIEATFKCIPTFNIKGMETISKVNKCKIDLFGSGKNCLKNFLIKTHYSRLILIFFVYIFFTGKAVSQPVIEIRKDNELLKIGKAIMTYTDESNELSLTELLKAQNEIKFKQGEQIIPNIGITDAALWCKFRIQNNTSEDCYLEISNTALDSISVFEVFAGNNFAEKKSGVYINFNKREIKINNYLFRLCGKTDSVKTFFVRIHHSRGTQFPIYAGTLKGFMEYHHRVDFIQGIYFGFMILMILYNLFIYFTVRDPSYLLYVLYVALMTLLNASLNGYGFEYLWRSNAWFGRYEDLISGSLGISGILFATSFLRTKQNVPFIHKIFKTMLVLLSAGIVIVLTKSFLIGTVVIELISLLLILLFFIAAIKVLRKGYKPAKFFLIAWSVLLLSVVVFIFKDFNLIPYSMLTAHSLQIGSAIEALLLSFALANRINIYKKEKEEAQLQSLNSLKENEKLILTQNIMLESKVEERTHDLQQSLQQLKKTQLQLVQHEKMASLGNLTAGIAHEMQNPLNFVNNFSLMCQEAISDLEEGKTEDEKKTALHDLKVYLDKINNHGRRAESIVKNMLEHGHSGTGIPRPANINKLCSEYLNISYHSITVKDAAFTCAIENNFAKDIPEISIIAEDISRVLANIFNNAFYEVNEKRKNLTGEYKPAVMVSTSMQNKKISISVTDNGNGIKKDKMQKIFEPFFTTKPSGQGTGLGLSISYDIIKAHEGEITVESEEGAGATFTITLPVS